MTTTQFLATLDTTHLGAQPATFCTANKLVANVAENITVPTNAQSGLPANIVMFGKPVAADFYALPMTAARAANRVEDGTLASYVTNGTFASDTGWTKGTGWTIAAGVATATGAISTALSQTSPVTLVSGRKYAVTFTVTAASAGSVAISLGGGTAGTSRSTAATFTEVITAGATQIIAFTGTGFTGSIDNIFIIPFEIGAGWVVSSGTATATTASTAISQSALTSTPLVAGKSYVVTYTITRSAGTIAASLGGGTAGAANNADGTYSEVLIAGATQVIAFTGSGFSGTIDNITVNECAQIPADDSDGEAPILNPPGMILNGAEVVSIISAGTPTITCQFFK